MKNKIRYTILPTSIGKGMLAILILAQQHGRSVKIDTGVNVFKGQWDDEEGMVVDNPNSKNLNKTIRQAIYDLETLEYDADGNISLSKLKKSYENKELSFDFYLMVEKAIPNRDVTKNTQENHWTWLKKIRKFKPVCYIHELTEDFAKDFHRWLNKQNWSEATVKKDMQTLKAFWNYAKKIYGNKVSDDMFDWYKPKYNLGFKNKGLEDDDIRLIENFISRPDIKDVERECMEQFLFMSYTGCRYSDFKSLSEKNFTYESGRLWLTYTSIKTNTYVRIPIFALFDGRAEQLYIKHLNDLDSFFKLRCNGHYNQIIQRVCKRIGINKRITCHVARHTCATRLINKDIPVTTIQKVIGHRQIRMTMQYAHTNDNSMVRQLGR